VGRELRLPCVPRLAQSSLGRGATSLWHLFLTARAPLTVAGHPCRSSVPGHGFFAPRDLSATQFAGRSTPHWRGRQGEGGAPCGTGTTLDVAGGPEYIRWTLCDGGLRWGSVLSLRGGFLGGVGGRRW